MFKGDTTMDKLRSRSIDPEAGRSFIEVGGIVMAIAAMLLYMNPIAFGICSTLGFCVIWELWHEEKIYEGDGRWASPEERFGKSL